MARPMRRGTTPQFAKDQKPCLRAAASRMAFACCALLLAVSPPAQAQNSGDSTGSGNASPPASPASLSGQSSGEVTLDVERFGLGDNARPGEIAAVRIRALDQGVKPREVLIRLEGRDPDGDTPYFERQVVLNPNVVQGIWLYPLIPRNFDTSDGMTLSAFEVLTGATEVGGDAGTGESAAKGKLGLLLGRTTVRMKTRIAPYDAVIGVVGTSSLSYGLGDYAIVDGSNPWSASGHEIIRTIEGLRTTDLPDRWMGYTSFDAMVWGAGDPLELRGDRASALREWVQRGGHLIIIMPVAGQAWTNASANELHDLLPNVTISRHEGVDMAPYGPLLTRKPQARFPKDSVVYTFEPAQGALPGEAMRILSGVEGKCVVARRLVGTGAVTLIGLDLNHRLLTSQDLVNADTFWNKVLGKRGTVRSQIELSTLQARGYQSREEKLFESDITGAIAKSGRSAAGLLLALVVFALYWLVAGPGGYAMLKRMGMVRHAWVGFFAAAGLFTAIAWGGAVLLRPSKVEVAHLTILDHVYGQPVERARSWMSVLIPWYGQATMEVGEAPKTGELAGRGGGDVLLPWTSPDQAQAGQDMFPDARGYEIQSRSPRSLTVPTRSTVKQLRADWSGGPPWQMPTPVGDPADPATAVLHLTEDGKARGKLVHGLPGPLHDVVIIVVRGQKPVTYPIANFMISRVNAYGLPSTDAWDPGEELDIGAVTNTNSLSTAGEAFFSTLLGTGATQDITAAPNQPRMDDTAPKRLTALGFFSQFEPPSYTEAAQTTREAVARRTETHGWDLGMWFTQPCIIIVGHLGTDKEPLASPIPFRIDGEQVTPMGRTMVRWIYPLPDNPPPFKSETGTEQDGGDGSAAADARPDAKVDGVEVGKPR